MRIKLGHIRFLMAVSAALALLLFPVSSALNNEALMYAALTCFVFSGILWLCFYRCPHCKKRLGQSARRTCPSCGKKL